jgi:hypothetical protein
VHGQAEPPGGPIAGGRPRKVESSREQSTAIGDASFRFGLGVSAVSAERMLARHARVHGRLVRLAGQRLSRRDYAAALVYTQAAAEYAWRCPTGTFASPALERLVAAVRIAALKPHPPRCAGSRAGDEPTRVLHVLTRAEGIGGHTRLCWNWLRADNARQHSVALTGQGVWPVPPELERAVADIAGTLDLLDAGRPDILSRARALRALAANADLIVLHVHPYDVVPLLALGGPAERPPTVFMNHSDHSFWLGLDASDVVAHFRPSGAVLSRDRRSLAPDRSVSLPLPLAAEEKVSRSAARAQLDIPERACVLLTVAASQKYDVDEGPSMVDALLPILERFPDCLLIAVGPRQEGVWAAAARRLAGRVRAVGIQHDISPYLAAADIYLDSFPTTSVTAMLEAGQHGLPLLRLDPLEVSGASPLDPDDPALNEALVVAADADSYQAVIGSWLSDAGERAQHGETAKRLIEDYHGGTNWRACVDRVYAQAARVIVPSINRPDPPHLSTEFDLALVEMSSRGAVDVYFVRRLLDHCASLSPRGAVTMAIRFVIAMRSDLPSTVAHRQRIWRRLRRNASN